MSIEIERKFLIKSTTFKNEAHQKSYIKQGFLNSNKNRVVRVRVKGEKAFLTIKGKSNKEGISRFEWEKEINKTEAEALFLLCEKEFIEKYRYLVNYKNHVFEVDEFLGKNKGLLIAEIELSSEKEEFKKPEWLGKEVTGKKKYYNSSLSKKPFCSW